MIHHCRIQKWLGRDERAGEPYSDIALKALGDAVGQFFGVQMR